MHYLRHEKSLDDVDIARFITVEQMVKNTHKNVSDFAAVRMVSDEDCAAYHLVQAAISPSKVARELMGFAHIALDHMDEPFPAEAIRWSPEDVMEKAVPILRKLAGHSSPMSVKCTGPGCGYAGIKTYECENCGSLCCYCFGASDDHFEWCDDCVSEKNDVDPAKENGAQA